MWIELSCRTPRSNIMLTVLLFWILMNTQAQDTVKVYKETCPTLDDMTDAQYTELITEMLNTTQPQDQKIDRAAFDCRNVMSLTKSVCRLLLSSNTSPALFHTQCRTGRYLKSLFLSLQVHHTRMQFESKCIGDASGQEDSIRSRTTDVAHLFINLMDKWGWKKIVVFTDVDVAYVLKDFSRQFVSVVIFRVRTENQVTEFMEKDQVKSSVVNHFFVLCNPVNTRMVLQVAQNQNLLTEPNTWLIMSDVSADEMFKDFAIPYDTFVALASASSFTPSSQQQPAALLLAEPTKGKSMDAVLSGCSSFSSEDIRRTEEPQNTQVSRIRPLVVELSEVYSVGGSSTVLKQDFGSWSSELGLFMWRPFPNTLRNLNGLHLRITTTEVPPFIMLNDTSGKKEVDGFYGEIFKVLAKEINFTYTIQPVEDGLFGSLQNNKWNGMIGELVENRADIAICDISITKDRKLYVEFSPSLSLAAIKILYRKPQERFHYKLYILPFDANIWVLVIISMLVSGGALHVAGKFSPNSVLQQPVEDEKERLKALHDYSLANCFLTAYNGFVQQGAEVDPQEVSGKIIFVTIYLSFVIVFSSYTSIFTSFLTIKDTTLPIETMQDLLADTSYKIGLQKSTSQLNYFQAAAADTEAGKVWTVIQKDPNNIVPSVKEGTDRAYQTKYAFITPEESTIYFLKDKICNYVLGKQEIIRETFHFAYRKDFLYAQTFNAYIDRLTESGIIQRIQRRYEGDKLQLCDDGSEVKSLGFKRVVSLFLLLTGAGLMAALILAYEKFVHPRIYPNRKASAKNQLMPAPGWMPSPIGRPHPIQPSAILLSRPEHEKDVGSFVHRGFEPGNYKGYYFKS